MSGLHEISAEERGENVEKKKKKKKDNNQPPSGNGGGVRNPKNHKLGEQEAEPSKSGRNGGISVSNRGNNTMGKLWKKKKLLNGKKEGRREQLLLIMDMENLGGSSITRHESIRESEAKTPKQRKSVECRDKKKWEGKFLFSVGKRERKLVLRYRLFW